MSQEDRINAVKAIEAARNSLFEASCFASGLALRLIEEANSAAKLAIEMVNDQDYGQQRRWDRASSDGPHDQTGDLIK